MGDRYDWKCRRVDKVEGKKRKEMGKEATNLAAEFLAIYKLDNCIVWNAHNTVFGSKRTAVHNLFTSCIQQGLVSRDSIVNGDWLPATE